MSFTLKTLAKKYDKYIRNVCSTTEPGEKFKNQKHVRKCYATQGKYISNLKKVQFREVALRLEAFPI